MKKIGAVLSRAVKQTIEYRSEVLVWFLIDAIPLLIVVIIWQNLYQGQATFSGYSFGEMVWYYFLALVVSSATSSHFESYRTEEIRNGKIDFHFIRPWSFVKEIWYSHLGGKIISLIIKSPLLIFIGWQLTNNYDQVLQTGLAQSVGFGLMLILAFLIQSLISTTLTLAGFWFESGSALENFKWIFITLFSGSIIPIALMPDWLAKVVAFLPFKYLYAIPIEIIQGRRMINWSDYFYASLFIIALLLLVQILERAGRKIYAAYGG